MPKIKHTKKYNSSEVLNSTNKTNKYINLYNTILKKKKHKQINTNVDTKHNINQRGSGGMIFNQQRETSVFGKSIDEHDITVDRFDVSTKQQYKQLKKDVKATMLKAFIAKKKGIIKEIDYDLQIHLLSANLYFAKMKLYQAKLALISNKLIGNNSIIKKIHKNINEIFSLQMTLGQGHNIASQTSKLTTKPQSKNIVKIIKQQDKCRYTLLKLISFTN
jgi:hypothetical protein